MIYGFFMGVVALLTAYAILNLTWQVALWNEHR